MSAFSAEWLALREPADWRSRSARVTNAVVYALPKGRVVRAVDLAAGTGSNTRFLRRTLTPPQERLSVHHDPDLFSSAPSRRSGFDIRTHAMDLWHTGELATVLQGQEMVTASALLDLVSEEWLQALCATCRSQRSVVLFALSYDGRMIPLPEEPEDELVEPSRIVINRPTKGLAGRSGLTPQRGRRSSSKTWATRSCAIEATGCSIASRRSWQRQLIDGWAEAATAIAPAEAEIIGRWRKRRIEHIAGERSRVIVGHEDLGVFIA